MGYARAISDGVSLAYLADLFVLPEARGRGLGTEIVRELVERARVLVRWRLPHRGCTRPVREVRVVAANPVVLERPSSIRD